MFAADIFASQFGDGHPNLYMGLQFRDKVNDNQKRICVYSWILVVCDREYNASFSSFRCWPREEAMKPWNFSPVFLEGNHQHKLTSRADKVWFVISVHLTVGCSVMNLVKIEKCYFTKLNNFLLWSVTSVYWVFVNELRGPNALVSNIDYSTLQFFFLALNVTIL